MKKLLRSHPNLLFFGFLQIFFTAPGQTFFISLFVADVFSSLHMPISTFAGLYSLATILASLLLNPAGRLIDHHPPKIILFCITLLMALGCFILAAAHSLSMVFMGFFIVRLIGQGVFVLTSTTLINRNFHKNRGKAHSFISLGYPASEIIYPSLAFFLLSIVGWRYSYLIFGLSTLLIMLPLQWLLLQHSRLKPGQFFPGEELIQTHRPPGQQIHPRHRSSTLPSSTLSQVIRDPSFYPILLASTIPPLVVSGLFFHQDTLFQAHHWSLEFATLGLSCYAIIKAIFSLGIGSFVDKKGPILPFVGIILLIAAATLIAALGGLSVISIPLYYACLGASLGMSAVVMNIIWVNLYGVTHIGSIKGFIGTFRNGFTGLAPFPIALALDKGLSIQAIFLGLAIVVFGLSFIPLIVSKLDRRLSF
ncbi:MAG: MFS transporter [bacterium]